MRNDSWNVLAFLFYFFIMTCSSHLLPPQYPCHFFSRFFFRFPFFHNSLYVLFPHHSGGDGTFLNWTDYWAELMKGKYNSLNNWSWFWISVLLSWTFLKSYYFLRPKKINHWFVKPTTGHLLGVVECKLHYPWIYRPLMFN